jgi:hypothetical protein
MHGDFINENIGTPSDADFIDLQGFDYKSRRPIITYVSKLIDDQGFQLRNYKISIGGAVPLNNDDLIVQYDDSTIDFISQLVTVDYMDN